MAKFTATVIHGYRVTIDRDARKAENLQIGDLVEVDVKLMKKAEAASE